MVKIPGFSKKQAMKKAEKQFVEIAYCCYLYGVLNNGIPLPFEMFCARVKEIHETGKLEWKNLSKSI